MLFFAHPAFAQQVETGINEVGETIALGGADIRIIIARIIRIALSFLGILAVALIIYAGFTWMTSGGEEEKVSKAKKILANAVIGLAIILSALAITQFVMNRLLEATGGRIPSAPGGAAGGGIPRSGSLGAGIIEDHFPFRGATVCRNTRIVVTFKEPVSVEGFADDIRIYPSEQGEDAAIPSENLQVNFTEDGRTVVVRPPLLGSPTARTVYNVSLRGGADGVRLASGEPAFDGAFGAGYLWDFTVDTCLDTTPPQVTDVIPRRDSREPRNTIIQVNFSEAMDPTSVAGVLPGFQNVRVLSDASPVAGTVAIGNGYRTIEFISTEACGTNACGSTIFCLPAASTISTNIRAATLSTEPPAADPAIFPADGATDMAANSLDGDADNVAEGPGADDFSHRFSTTDAIDLTPPVVESLDPAPETGRVAPDAAVRIGFSKLMSVLSFGGGNISITETPAPREPTCYRLGGEIDEDVRTRAVIFHCPFMPETNIAPNISSGVTDLRQNCYVPGATTVIPECSPERMAAAGATFCCSGDPCTRACTITPAGLPRCPSP